MHRLRRNILRLSYHTGSENPLSLPAAATMLPSLALFNLTRTSPYSAPNVAPTNIWGLRFPRTQTRSISALSSPPFQRCFSAQPAHVGEMAADSEEPKISQVVEEKKKKTSRSRRSKKSKASTNAINNNTTKPSPFSTVADLSRFQTPAIILEDNQHPFTPQSLPPHAWTVLCGLRKAGHETYICGGTVRDILLNKPFKDVDILTSAEPRQVKKVFPRAFAVGRHFPVVHVHLNGSVLEVSSFKTNADVTQIPLDAYQLSSLDKRQTTVNGDSSHAGSSGLEDTLLLMKAGGKAAGKKLSRSQRRKFRLLEDMIPEDSSLLATTHDPIQDDISGGNNADTERGLNSATTQNQPTWAVARRLNASRRDFTCNGLLLDPFSRILFDYVDGVHDCQANILKTIGNPIESFTEDPARMLRAIRLAARTGLEIESSTADAIDLLGLSGISKLSSGRLQMELWSMLVHGASAKSVAMLWKFGLLGMVLPHHSLYLQRHKVVRRGATLVQNFLPTTKEVDDEHNINKPSVDLLFKLFILLDSTVRDPKDPVDPAVVVALLAAPLIAEECAAHRQQNNHNHNHSSTSIDISGDDAVLDSSLGSSSINNANENEWGLHTTATTPSSSTAQQDDDSNEALKVDQQSSDDDDEEDSDTEEDSIDELNNIAASNSNEAYMEVYCRIVHRVVERLSSSLNKRTQRSVMTQLKKTQKKKAKRRQEVFEEENTMNEEGAVHVVDDDDIDTLNDGLMQSSDSNNNTDSSSFPVLSAGSLISRVSAERAAVLLIMEAEMDLSSFSNTSTAAFNSNYEFDGSSGGGAEKGVDGLVNKKQRKRSKKDRHSGGSSKHGKLSKDEKLALAILRNKDVHWPELRAF